MKKKTLLFIRFILILSTILVMVYSKKGLKNVFEPGYITALIYFISNIFFYRIPDKKFSKTSVSFFIFLFDIIAVSLAIYFTQGIETDFYLIYFLVIFIASVGQDIRGSLPIAIVASVIYSWLVYRSNPGVSLVNSTLLIRIPFLFIISLVSSYWSESTRRELKEKEELERFNRELKKEITKTVARYRNLFEHVPVGIYQTTPEGRILDVNPAIVQMLGYPDKESILSKKAGDMYVDPDDRMHWQDAMKSEGCVHDFKTQFRRRDRTIIWVEDSARTFRNEDSQMLYYEGTLKNITERMQAQQDLQMSLEKLQRILEGTVNSLASALGKRDLYTAGHQQRVTKLACAIAREKNLSKEQINGIRIAGLLHDIGKIAVPSEILTKPSRLTNAEFNIIKTHPQVGYDILKPIEFPWPVAETVLQHHERLDGSGYPKGLKNRKILLEAKIVGVADVVEAMFSYRPYRPARDWDTILEEISKNKGVLYEPQVVDICIKLFKGKRFKFE